MKVYKYNVIYNVTVERYIVIQKERMISMNKEQSQLFDIIETFYEGEYGYDMEEFELKEDLIKNLKLDHVPIAASEFGEITEFSGETVYIPSQNVIYKGIYSVEYEKSFKEKLYFKDIESFQEYLYGESFDSLLAPEIEEKELIKIVKSV